MTSHGSVTQTVNKLRHHDQSVRNQAAQQIWDRYFRALLRLARNNLGRRIRPRADEQDVLQSAYNSFCEGMRQGAYNLADREALWKLLVTITRNKSRDLAKYQGRGKRDIAREQAMQGGDETDSARWAPEQLEAAGPSPQDAALLNEALERRLEALGDPELQQIALWRSEGYAEREIADKLDCVPRTVERRLKLIREKMTSFDDSAS